MIAAAAFMCCVPMAMPQGHLVALCSDLGIAPSHGAAMLSVLLACAFVSRQFWGWMSDRIGGLRTVLAGSLCQIVAMVGFLLTQSETGLFAVPVFFGFGFSGWSLPMCWRSRTVSSCRSLVARADLASVQRVGMAAGGWLAGLIYDAFGFYGAAFAAAIAFNLINLVIVASLVLRVHARVGTGRACRNRGRLTAED
jgi:predicted MFS family arabinose efflux permease